MLGCKNESSRWHKRTLHTVSTFDYGANMVLSLLPQLRPDFVVTVGDPRWFITFAQSVKGARAKRTQQPIEKITEENG
jgi:hypothetical protein